MVRPRQLRQQLSGAATVGLGLGLLGVAAYVFLALAAQSLGPADYAAIASLYFLTAIVGPGLFVAVEQETNREISSRIATGAGTSPVVRSAAVVSGGLGCVVSLVLLAVSPWLVEQVYAGSWPLMIATIVAVWGAAAVYVLRGVFAGEQRFGWYSSTLAGEGLARLLPCVVLVLLGVGAPTPFGVVFVLGAVVAAAVTVGGLRHGSPGPAVDRSGMARGVALLACASGLTLLVANLAPVVLTSRLVDDPATAASFASLFVLARTPLFLFAPVQALLLPRLAAAAATGDVAGLRRQLGVVMGAVAVVGLAGAGLAAVAGPWTARVFFASPTDLPMVVAGLLGLSTAAMMAAQILQSALVALRAHRSATLAWATGTALFLALVLAPGDPIAAAVTAQLVAPFVVVGILAAMVRRSVGRLRREHSGPR